MQCVRDRIPSSKGGWGWGGWSMKGVVSLPTLSDLVRPLHLLVNQTTIWSLCWVSMVTESIFNLFYLRQSKIPKKLSTSAYKCVDITQMLRSGGCQKYQTVQDGWECPLGRVWSVRSSLLVDELIKLRPVPIHSCHQGWKMSHQRKMGGNQSFVDFSSCGSFHDMSTRKSWNYTPACDNRSLLWVVAFVCSLHFVALHCQMVMLQQNLLSKLVPPFSPQSSKYGKPCESKRSPCMTFWSWAGWKGSGILWVFKYSFSQRSSKNLFLQLWLLGWHEIKILSAIVTSNIWPVASLEMGNSKLGASHQIRSKICFEIIFLKFFSFGLNDWNAPQKYE